jgi:hypothetical protein
MRASANPLLSESIVSRYHSVCTSQAFEILGEQATESRMERTTGRAKFGFGSQAT